MYCINLFNTLHLVPYCKIKIYTGSETDKDLTKQQNVLLEFFISKIFEFMVLYVV